MEIVIALIPALCWGSLGILSTKFGGNSSQQTLGLTLGGLIFGIVSYVFWVLPNGYYLDSTIIIIGLISGVLWTVGQAFQFVAIKKMGGVSIAVPLSMTSQLVGNALLGAAILSEWSTGAQWLVGIIGIILILIGALFIQAPSKSEKTANNVAGRNKGLAYIAISTLGFMGYFIAPKLLQIWMNVPSDVINAGRGINYMIAIIFPQSIGMVIGSFLYIFLISHETKDMFTKVTGKNMITGLVWAIGNVALFVSIANPELGQAVSSTLSQLGFIVGALGGIFILHEAKSKKQLNFVILGIAVAVLGAVVISNINFFTTLL